MLLGCKAIELGQQGSSLESEASVSDLNLQGIVNNEKYWKTIWKLNFS